MNNDLISREALKEAFEKVYPLSVNEMGGVVNQHIYDIIDSAPTVETYTIEDIQEVRENALILGAKLAQRPKGEWEVFYTQKQKKVFRCDKCLAISIQGKTNFCGNCGSDMKGGAE